MRSNKYLVLVFSLFLAGAVSAATVTVNEGEFETVQAANDMLYPNIDSCLTVTYAYDTGVRSGGHAVLFPEQGQETLEQMVQTLSGKNKANFFYILGAIGVWNDNYFGQTGRNFTINGAVVNLKNVEGIVQALGYDAKSNAVLYDKDDYTTRPVAILFQANPKMLKITVPTEAGKVIYNQPWPKYKPPATQINKTIF